MEGALRERDESRAAAEAARTAAGGQEQQGSQALQEAQSHITALMTQLAEARRSLDTTSSGVQGLQADKEALQQQVGFTGFLLINTISTPLGVYHGTCKQAYKSSQP